MATQLATAPQVTTQKGTREGTFRARRSRRRRRRMLATLTLVAVSLVMISPLVWTAMAATKPTRAAFANPPQFAYQPTFDAFVTLWQETDFYRYLINTVLIGLMAVVGTLLISAPAAYALSRMGGRVSAIILAVAFLFRSIPGFAIVLPFYQLATNLGIFDTPVALAVAFIAVDQPFTIWLLRNFFAAIPVELDEAAMIDGCTRWASAASFCPSWDRA